MSGNNKLTHVLVPRHQVLSKEESERLLKELGVKAWQLPRIAQDDPAIRDLNAEVGQIVRVTRSSELVGEYEVYRLVVASFSQKTAPQKKEASAEAESAKKGVGAKPAKRVKKESKKAADTKAVKASRAKKGSSAKSNKKPKE